MLLSLRSVFLLSCEDVDRLVSHLFSLFFDPRHHQIAHRFDRTVSEQKVYTQRNSSIFSGFDSCMFLRNCSFIDALTMPMVTGFEFIRGAALRQSLKMASVVFSGRCFMTV